MGKNVSWNDENQPIINVTASFFALLLLITGPVRDDALQTLLAPQPMDRLFYRKNGSRVRWWTWLGNFICVMPLQIAWGLRMMFTPTMAVLGTSLALSSCESAIDIVSTKASLFRARAHRVTHPDPPQHSALFTLSREHWVCFQVLNSVAIGFIFELDDMMYAMMLGRNARHQYSNTPPVAGTCLAVPGSPRVAEWYSWLLCVGDFAIACVTYISDAFGFDWEVHNLFEGMLQIATLMWIRAGVLAAAATHLAYRARAHKLREHARRLSGSFKGLGSLGAKARRSTDDKEEQTAAPTRWKTCGRQALRLSFEIGRMVMSAGLVISLSVFVNKICYQYASFNLGFATTCIGWGSELDLCLNSWTKSAACSNNVLNWTAPGEDRLQMDYSYEDEFWSMKDFGPARVGCLRPNGSPRFGSI